MIGRAFLHMHVHLATGGDFERAHVDVTVAELEGEPVAGDQEPRFTRAGDRHPDALELIQMATAFRFGQGVRDGRHGTSPGTDAERGGPRTPRGPATADSTDWWGL